MKKRTEGKDGEREEKSRPRSEGFYVSVSLASFEFRRYLCYYSGTNKLLHQFAYLLADTFGRSGGSKFSAVTHPTRASILVKWRAF